MVLYEVDQLSCHGLPDQEVQFVFFNLDSVLPCAVAQG